MTDADGARTEPPEAPPRSEVDTEHIAGNCRSTFICRNTAAARRRQTGLRLRQAQVDPSVDGKQRRVWRESVLLHAYLGGVPRRCL